MKSRDGRVSCPCGQRSRDPHVIASHREENGLAVIEATGAGSAIGVA
jgi:hypothetical protein